MSSHSVPGRTYANVDEAKRLKETIVVDTGSHFVRRFADASLSDFFPACGADLFLLVLLITFLL